MKPSPLVPVNVWRHQVEKTLQFLENLPRHLALHGKRWSDGMRRYYGKQLENLLDHPPELAPGELEVYRSRLSRV
jgi:hypothetical protein